MNDNDRAAITKRRSPSANQMSCAFLMLFVDTTINEGNVFCLIAETIQ